MSLPARIKQVKINENAPRHKCGHCGNEGCADLVGVFQYSNNNNSVVDFWRNWNIYFCPNCDDINVERIDTCSENIDIGHDEMGREQLMLIPDIQQLYPLKNFGTIGMSRNIPSKLQEDYEEAQCVAGISPRSAAALLRLLLEKLCRKYLSEIGKIKGSEKLNQMIGILVKEGISDSIQKACDILRITGNETVHAGIIDIRDNPESVKFLFELVNMIADELHLRYKKIPERYEKLPQDKLNGIQNRDK